MKKNYLAIATLLFVTAGSVLAFAPPRSGRNGNSQAGTAQCPTPGQQAGQRNGKKIGAQDGSGPIHTPGTGGGTGAGTRRGRK
jgi:hypothetical protein